MNSLDTAQPIKNRFKNKSIISLDQFDRASLDTVFGRAKRIAGQVKRGTYPKPLKNKLITLLFFEPSSRTFSSFTAAAKRLGAVTIEYQNPTQTSSAVKGETLEDTIRTFINYSDAIVMRHYEPGAAMKAYSVSAGIPILNAGDGTGEHPTQALLDLYTLTSHFGNLDGIKGLMVGDLLNGRTIHSLLRGLALYKKAEVYLLAPQSLKLKKEDRELFEAKGVRIHEIKSADDIPTDCRFWYWTRVQKERFKDSKEYEKLKHSFILTPELLKRKGNKHMVIMHPLPRVGEIDTQIDSDPRAIYLTEHMRNGVYVRMALLSLVLGGK